jgi:hypothetical protein
MVAKAATKAGEFFCFHCGKQVAQEDYECKGCGAGFDRIVRAFRCPRCARILPVGAVVCPACGLGFKIRSVTGTKQLTKDEEMLVELIDWGKQPDAPAPESQMASEGAGAISTLKHHHQSDNAFSIRDVAQSDSGHMQADAQGMPSESQAGEGAPPAQSSDVAVPRGSSRAVYLPDGAETSLVKTSEGMEPASVHPTPQEQTIRHAEGLSNQALKKLLEEREREVLALKNREDEMARREEHLGRLMRDYAAKRKEFEALRRKAAAQDEALSEPMEPAEFPGSLLVDDKDEWMREQSRIKTGLIEIRNTMGSREEQMDYYPPRVSNEILQKMESLEEKLIDVSREREEIAARLKKLESRMDDAKDILTALDQLLGRLPPEVIEEFSKSKDFKLYEKVLEDLRI